MLRPTDRYGERRGGILERLLMRGALLLVTVVVIGALAGWTKRVKAADGDGGPRREAGRAPSWARWSSQLDGTQRRADAGQARARSRQRDHRELGQVSIPADLAAAIYDIALSEGIDPALGFQLVKVESSFKATARSSMQRDRVHPAPGPDGALLRAAA